tara:strand:+ start:420 stop:809 length:390 start_codon:yes stop_codon:yes gene_type:complete
MDNFLFITNAIIILFTIYTMYKPQFKRLYNYFNIIDIDNEEESKYEIIIERLDSMDICMNLKFKNFKKEIFNHCQMDKEFIEDNVYQREMFDIRDRIHMLEDQVNKICSKVLELENNIVKQKNMDEIFH